MGHREAIRREVDCAEGWGLSVLGMVEKAVKCGDKVEYSELLKSIGRRSTASAYYARKAQALQAEERLSPFAVVTGGRFDPARPVRETAKLLRRDIRSSIDAGILPPGLAVRVTSRKGSARVAPAIQVTVTGSPSACLVLPPLWAGGVRNGRIEEDLNRNGFRTLGILESLGALYNRRYEAVSLYESREFPSELDITVNVGPVMASQLAGSEQELGDKSWGKRAGYGNWTQPSFEEVPPGCAAGFEVQSAGNAWEALDDIRRKGFSAWRWKPGIGDFLDRNLVMVCARTPQGDEFILRWATSQQWDQKTIHGWQPLWYCHACREKGREPGTSYINS